MIILCLVSCPCPVRGDSHALCRGVSGIQQNNQKLPGSDPGSSFFQSLRSRLRRLRLTGLCDKICCNYAQCAETARRVRLPGGGAHGRSLLGQPLLGRDNGRLPGHPARRAALHHAEDTGAAGQEAHFHPLCRPPQRRPLARVRLSGRIAGDRGPELGVRHLPPRGLPARAEKLLAGARNFVLR